MKKTYAALLVMLLLGQSAVADTYKVNFVAPSNTGKPWNYGFVVDLQFGDAGVITGEIKEFYGASACRWPGVKISGGNLQDGNFRWITEENIVKGCGKLVFVGRKDGEKLVGYLPRFQGVKVDLELEPTK
jgi:hypothetical protein